MQKKWKRSLWLTVPLLAATTVYALAAGGKVESQAANEWQTEAAGSGVSYQRVSAEPLTAEELRQLEGATLAPQGQQATESAQGSVNRELLDAHNPFVVQGGTKVAASGGVAGGAASGADGLAHSTGFQLDLVKKLELKSFTNLGELKLEFENKEGKVELEGKIGERKLELEGAAAVALLERLLQNFELKQALTFVLAGQPVSLDHQALGAIEELKVELKDGRKVESNGKGGGPKAEGRHDNGKHKGHEKEHGKGKEKGNGKEHDDD
jgi:hypothetical protein